MAISIKNVGGIINEVPKITNFNVLLHTKELIEIEYKVEDDESTICRHYITVKDSSSTIMDHVEITKKVGYEPDSKIFTYQITGLTKNTTYTIQIGVSDGIDESLSEAIQQKTDNNSLYGVSVDEKNSNPSTCITYIEDAVGVTPATPTSLGDWGKRWPFYATRLVGFRDGQVTKEINPYNKTQYIDGETVPDFIDVMVEIPKVYWKFTDTTNGYEVRISDIKLEGYDCYAHKVAGVEKDFIYVGAYLGSIGSRGDLRSKSGASPLKNINHQSGRTYAQSVGSGYQQWNWFTQTLIQILYLIAYKSLDSQTALGAGRSGGSFPTGGTNTKGMVFGEPSGGLQMCFLGIEDLWGNLSVWCDGMAINSNCETLLTTDNKNFNDTAKGYKNFGFLIEDEGHKYINAMMGRASHKNETGFFPISGGGSNTIHYCDYVYVSPESGLPATFSYYSRPGNVNSGIFTIELSSGPTLTRSECGARLCYLG